MAEITLRMDNGAANATARVYMLLFPIPVVCFIGALLTDIAYSRSAYLMWLHFSEWLIAAGLFFGALAALTLLVEFVANRFIRKEAVGWSHLVLFYASLVVELFNAFVHTIDGWTAVVPTGLALSIVGAIFALGAVATLYMLPITCFAFREARP